MRLGVPELIIGLLVALVQALPIVVAVWALIMLRRIRATQEDLLVKVSAIERLIESGKSA